MSYSADEVTMDPIAPVPTTPAAVPEHAAPSPKTFDPGQNGLIPLVEQNAPAAGLGTQELGALAQQTGGNAWLAIALAVVALLSLGIWKHLDKVSERKHEQAMKQAELDAQKAGLNGAQPPPCQAAQVKLEADIAACKSALSVMEQKVAAMEKTLAKVSAAVPNDIDIGEQEDRLTKLEKSLRALRSSKRSGL